MSLLRRHIGRRVAGVGVGVALLVLGLEAPAFAVPTVSGVAPTSGPANCVVTITGTGFKDFTEADQTLTFVGPVSGAGDDLALADANWFANSATEILAVSPAVVAGTTYTVTLTDPTGGTSTGTFAATSGAGGCAPTIASFTPTCGAAGTVVVITGTNLLDAGLDGATVAFNPYAAAQVAAHTVPDVDTTTSLSVIVPTGTVDGKIRVTTNVDTDPNTAGVQGVFSTANFEVPPPDCVAAVPFARSITLKLAKHLVAKGKVSAAAVTPPAPAECTAGVPVKIQRKKGGSWKTIAKTTTSDTGAYKRKIKDKPGKYRARAVKITLESGAVCAKATSPVRTHKH
jgi:IPT/TIG domain